MKKATVYIVMAALVAITVGIWGYLAMHSPVGNQFIGSAATQLALYGRLCGLLMGLIFLFLFLSMGKGRVLDRFLPKAQSAKIHRRLGLAVGALLFVHVGLLFAGRARLYDESFFAVLWDFLKNTLGASTGIGSVLLLIILVFCVLFILKKVKFPFWKKTHYFVYLMMPAVFFHQIISGSDFSSSTGFEVFWCVLAGIVALDVVIWKSRVLREKLAEKHATVH